MAHCDGPLTPVEDCNAEKPGGGAWFMVGAAKGCWRGLGEGQRRQIRIAVGFGIWLVHRCKQGEMVASHSGSDIMVTVLSPYASASRPREEQD